MNGKWVGVVGLIGAIGFWMALAVFAELDPNYTHATKAVSELGALGAPNATLWNVLGFGLVGVCLTVVGYQAARRIKPSSKSARIFLCCSGLAFVLTAVPADMNDLSATSSRVHIVASIASGGFWVLGCLLLLGKNAAGRYYFSTVTSVLLLAALATIFLRGANLVMPGYGRRLSFLVYFLWVAYVSVVMFQAAEPSSRRHH